MRAPDFDSDGWCLEDGEDRHRAAPATFHIPDLAERCFLQPGDLAKLIFMIAVEGDDCSAVERMWVIVRERIPGGYVGVLDNNPHSIAENDQLWRGTELPFEYRHIIAVEKKRREKCRTCESARSHPLESLKLEYAPACQCRLSAPATPWQHGSVWFSTGTCMTTQRRSYETGHKPKCLVIVDDTAEWDRAVYYASRWAIRVGGGVLMLRVIETEDQNQQWLGVADIMRAEAEEAANEALDRAAGRANGIAAITPERVIREGDPTEQILDVIDKDVDIAMLVLAANPGAEGPGPIITTMAKTMGAFPIPVTIVPGGLTDAEIDALS